MNMIFRFLESLLFGFSLECSLIIFGHPFEILRHFEFDVYFWDAGVGSRGNFWAVFPPPLPPPLTPHLSFLPDSHSSHLFPPAVFSRYRLRTPPPFRMRKER